MFNGSINIYTLLHFYSWFFIALFIPNEWLLAILYSIIWEITEYKLNKSNLIKKEWKSYLFYEALLNKKIDFVVNLIGYGVGVFFLKNILKKKNILA